MNNAGLPGTGLGGLFYVLLALWMPVAELWRTLRGHSSRERWRHVLTQFAMACGVVASVGVTVVAYRQLAGSPSVLGLGVSSLAFASVLVAAALLTILFAVLRLWAALIPNDAPKHRGDGRLGLARGRRAVPARANY